MASAQANTGSTENVKFGESLQLLLGMEDCGLHCCLVHDVQHAVCMGKSTLD